LKIHVLLIATMAPVLFMACDVKSPSWEPYNPFDYVVARSSESPGQGAPPIVSLPFGEMRVSPRSSAEDGSKDKPGSDSIYGFEHALSATIDTKKGGAILIMPTFGDPLFPAQQRKSERSLTAAQPGYYKTKLDRYNIFTETTVTPHTALHQFTFQDGWANVIVDISSASPDMSGGKILFNGPTQIGGYTFRSDLNKSKRHKVWFVVRFDRSAMDGGLFKNNRLLPKESTNVQGKDIGAYFAFRTREGGQIKIKVALSEKGIGEALMFLDEEQPGWTFPLIRQRARESWQKELSQIMVYGGEEKYKKIFYSALFECLDAARAANSDSAKQSAASTLLAVISDQFCSTSGTQGAVAGIDMSKEALAAETTARSIRASIDRQFSATPFRLPADGGSAVFASWLVQAMIGLIPACPENNYYIVPPFFNRTEIKLADGALFIIESPKVSKNSDRIKSVKLNGKALPAPVLNDADIHAGGRLTVRQ